MRTCWVLDHPAHVRLLAHLLRDGSTADLIVACERPEVRAMVEQGDGRLPRRQTLWVPRPVGEGRHRKALYRLRRVQRFIKAANKDGQGPVERIVGVGAALEMLATKPRWWRRSTVRERWYITDTEVNHLAHRLAMKSATHAVVPTHWRADLDGGFLAPLAAQSIDWMAFTGMFISPASASFGKVLPASSVGSSSWSAVAFTTWTRSLPCRVTPWTGEHHERR